MKAYMYAFSEKKLHPYGFVLKQPIKFAENNDE